MFFMGITLKLYTKLKKQPEEVHAHIHSVFTGY